MSSDARPNGQPRVVLFDWGEGDVLRILPFLEAAGTTVVLSHDRAAIAAAEGLVIAGDGNFAETLERLRIFRADEMIERRLSGGRPVLAIAAGMHIMFDRDSTDTTQGDGLGEWPGVVESVTGSESVHIGETSVDAPAHSLLFNGLSGELFHFACSRAVREWTLETYGAFAAPMVSTSHYDGGKFLAAVENGPLTAIQFNPAQSGEQGLSVLRNWVRSL